MAQVGKMTATFAGQGPQQAELHEEEEEQPQLSVPVAIVTLVVSTVLVALCAEFMVCSVFLLLLVVVVVVVGANASCLGRLD